MKVSYFAVIIGILFCLYIYNSERKIGKLKQQNKLQQITIKTNNAMLKKQSNIIKQNNKLKIDKQNNKQIIQKLKNENQTKLNNANNIYKKQQLLNNVI